MTREICEYVHCVFPRQRKGTDAMSTDARTSTRQDPSPVGSDTRSGDTRCRAVRRPGTKAGTARHGPGGAGKTRLAIEAAGRSVDDVYMVELEPLTDGTDILQAVLHALGLRDAGPRAPADRCRPGAWPSAIGA
jgi:hypothetical protein